MCSRILLRTVDREFYIIEKTTTTTDTTLTIVVITIFIIMVQDILSTRI